MHLMDCIYGLLATLCMYVRDLSCVCYSPFVQDDQDVTMGNVTCTLVVCCSRRKIYVDAVLAFFSLFAFIALKPQDRPSLCAL